jgi:O-methyltransferase
MEDPKALYLDLMKRTLTYLVYGQETFVPAKRPAGFIKRNVYDALRRRNVVPMRPISLDREARKNGRDWPPVAYTMIGMKRLDNLQYCAEIILRNNVPGDFIEAGTWRGGASIFLRSILKAYDVKDRSVFVADSFQGLPPVDADRFPADSGWDHTDPFLSVSLEQVKLNFSRYELLDDQVRFVKGWFKDTLPGLRDHVWSLLRLDADMYESTMDALQNLYPGLSSGGYVVIDDYGGLACCREAVNDFRDMHQIKDEIREIDWTGIYWQKGTSVSASAAKVGKANS